MDQLAPFHRADLLKKVRDIRGVHRIHEHAEQALITPFDRIYNSRHIRALKLIAALFRLITSFIYQIGIVHRRTFLTKAAGSCTSLRICNKKQQ